jgi:hypothetical protein
MQFCFTEFSIVSSSGAVGITPLLEVSQPLAYVVVVIVLQFIDFYSDWFCVLIAQAHKQSVAISDCLCASKPQGRYWHSGELFHRTPSCPGISRHFFSRKHV